MQLIRVDICLVLLAPSDGYIGTQTRLNLKNTFKAFTFIYPADVFCSK